MTQRFARTVTGLLIAAAAAALASAELRADPLPGRIEVRGLTGSASYSMAGSAGVRLRTGSVIPVGAIIKTEPRSAVDLSFSHNAGVVRLLQSSTLSVDKFALTDGTPGSAVEVQLYLSEGSMVGFEKTLGPASRFQVKVPQGIADVTAAKYRMSAQGYLVLLEGTAVFVFVPSGGEPVPFELKAVSPIYFSPFEGIKPAPAELVREVTLQTKGKLR